MFIVWGVHRVNRNPDRKLSQHVISAQAGICTCYCLSQTIGIKPIAVAAAVSFPGAGGKNWSLVLYCF